MRRYALYRVPILVLIMIKGSITPDALLKNASPAKPLIPYGTERLSDAPLKCHAARFVFVFQARLKVQIFSTLSARRGGVPLINVTLGQCSQSDQARGPMQPIESSKRPNAANRIKQEAGFPSCFPDENLILVVFNYEALYNSKSKHNSN